MDNFYRKTTILIFWLFIIIFSIQSLSIFAESRPTSDHIQEEQPSYSKLIQDTISTLKDTHQSYWEKIKATINDLQSQFLDPNLESSYAAGQKMKGGVEKSFETSKETVQESAKSAADAVEKTMQNTANKVKGSTSENEYKEEL